MKTLERGFKAWAERTAVAVRKELKITVDDLLCPFSLAENLGIGVLPPEKIPGMTDDILRPLIIEDPSGWSATSFRKNNKSTVIYNPKHSPGRRSSDITHELAHELLGHEPATVILSLELEHFCMRSFNQKQEDEANCLAWTLLVPREGLLRARSRRKTVEQIASQFGVSKSLINFRLQTTGILRQVGRFKY
jgi:Zn-dependent peptidase ImmA (M78 family)